jgi:zinc transporter ZupT
MMNLATE